MSIVSTFNDAVRATVEQIGWYLIWVLPRRVPRAPGLRLGLLTFPQSGIRLYLRRSFRRGLVSQCRRVFKAGLEFSGIHRHDAVWPDDQDFPAPHEKIHSGHD